MCSSDLIYRFLERTWRLFVDDQEQLRTGTSMSADVRRALHGAIKETTLGIEAMRFNTPISKMMELVNICRGEALPRDAQEAFLTILHPYAPHLAEELWRRLGHEASIYGEPWPQWDEDALRLEAVEIAVSVNGKLRGTVTIPRGADKDAMLSIARENVNVLRHLEGKEVVKEIAVPDKMVNFVVK